MPAQKIKDKLLSLGLLLIVWAMAFFCFSSSAFAVPKPGEWRARKTSHFIIQYQNCEEKLLSLFERTAEDAYYAVVEDTGLFRENSWLWDNRVFLYVFDTKDAYLAHTGLPEWSSGGAFIQAHSIYTYANLDAHFQGVVRHEIAHLVLQEFIKDALVPLWFAEGVAAFSEKQYALEKKRTLARLAAAGFYFPFEQFWGITSEDLSRPMQISGRMQSSEFFPKELTSVEIFYLQSFGVVSFLLDEYGQHRFVEMCRMIRDGKKFDDAFFSIYKHFRNRGEIEKQWLQFFQKK